MADNRVRIRIQYQGQEYFFVRMESATTLLMADKDSLRNAAMLTRESAVAVCKRLRELRYDAHIVTPEGTILFEDTIVSLQRRDQSAERQNMTIAGILIVVGNPPRGGFYIRFPGTQIESLWGSTPEEVYQRLLDHPLSTELMKAAEKYIAPPEPPIDTEALKRQLQFARHGRLRPADLG